MRRLLLIIPLLLIALACIPSAAPAPSPSGSPPVIIAFTATPSDITPGQQSTLSWNVTNATSVIIDNSIGSVAVAGTQIVSPNTTTTYTLIATNAYGPVSQSVAIVVGGVPPSIPPSPPGPLPGPLPGAKPNIALFDISPNVIIKHLGQKATMRWEVLGASNVRIDPGFGDVSHAGTRILSPPDDTLYTLTAHNVHGAVASTQKLTVKP